jgi:hypothetical protein
MSRDPGDDRFAASHAVHRLQSIASGVDAGREAKRAASHPVL